MSKTFRPYEPDQIILMPASMQDWLPSDHLAYFRSNPSLGVAHQTLFGILLIFIIIFLPNGIVGDFSKLTRLFKIGRASS